MTDRDKAKLARETYRVLTRRRVCAWCGHRKQYSAWCKLRKERISDEYGTCKAWEPA